MPPTGMDVQTTRPALSQIGTESRATLNRWLERKTKMTKTLPEMNLPKIGVKPRTCNPRVQHAGVVALFLVTMWYGPDAAAVAFRLPNQDPEAIARGNAFVATADNPSAIYYNPAGITQLPGQSVDVGIYAVSSGIKYESAAGPTAK